MEGREVVIVSGCRTAMANYGSHFTNIPMEKLGAIVIKEAMNRAGLPPEALEYVFFGHVMTDSRTPNVGRLALLHAGIPVTVPATTIDHQCGSSMEAINHCAREIKLGEHDVMIAGGVEVMSAAPYMSYDMRWGKRAGDAKFIDYFGTLAPTVSTDLSVTSPWQTPGHLPLNSGTEFAQAPDTSYTLGLQHTASLDSGATWVTRLDYNYQGQFWRSEPFLRVSGYAAVPDSFEESGDWGVVNLRFTYEPADANWQAAFFGTNLTDEYMLNSGFFHGIWGYDFATVGRPREVGASLTFRF